MISENISVDAALKRGHKMTSILGPILMLSLMMLMFAVFIYFMEKEIISGWMLPVSFFAGILLVGFISLFFAWLNWIIRIPRWKLWAFENVHNVHELKRRAIQEKIIAKDDSFFSKTEIWTKDQRIQWNIIVEKFKVSDIFIDDLSVPDITLIGFSKFTNFFEAGLFVFLFLVGFIFSVITDSYAIAAFTGFFGILIAYRIYIRYQSAINTETQISISNKGIETKSIPFQPWDAISNEATIIVGRASRTKKSYLIFDYPEGQAKINIDYLATSRPALNKLLRVYRARFNNEHNLG